MTGVPSIVAGLFIYTAFILTLGMRAQSGFAGALALSILMIPVDGPVDRGDAQARPERAARERRTRSACRKWRTILRVVLPDRAARASSPASCSPSPASSARRRRCCSPSFLSQSINQNPFSGPQASLPTFIYDQISRGTDASVDRAWAGALTLILHRHDPQPGRPSSSPASTESS